MLSIIIPTLNEEKYLPKLLRSIKNQSYRELEVIIADAHSVDRTVAIAKKFGAKIAIGGKTSFARNNGAGTANGDTLLFIDADVTFDKEFIKNIISEFKNRELDVATAKFDYSSFKTPSKLTYIFSDIVKKFFSNTRFAFGTGELILVKSEVFREIAGFNEKLTVGEDVDFFRRCVKNGFRYGILDQKFKPSDRRLKSLGTFRVFSASIIAVLLSKLQSNTKFEKIISNFYGGWGKW